jgi:hypothetical protein
MKRLITVLEAGRSSFEVLVSCHCIPAASFHSRRWKGKRVGKIQTFIMAAILSMGVEPS